MPTYLVWPPPFHQRVAFMDALQDVGLYVDREPEGFVVVVDQGQEQVWEEVRQRFQLEITEHDPPMIFGL